MNDSTLTLAAWLEKLENIHPLSMDFKLARIITVLQQLKLNPIAPLIISVAGTNGKGSTSTTTAHLFHALGLNVGLFTSPHIEKFNERIAINLVPTSDEELIEALQTIDKARADITLTYFEFATLAAFYLFKKHAVDVAILEVGLGGRLDSTNIVDADIAIITPIDIDHTAQLGHSISNIAREKAGIIKKNALVICAETNPPPPIIEAASTQRATLFTAQKDFRYRINEDLSWEYQFQDQTPLLLSAPKLLGQHQYQNSAAAITALFTSSYNKINTQHIEEALQKVTLAGRFQKLTKMGAPTVYLDVTHNLQGARTLNHLLLDLKKNHPGRCIAVFGMLKDKDAVNVVKSLNNVIDEWILCPINNVRGLSDKELSAIVHHEITTHYFLEPSIPNGCKKAVSIASKNDTILVFGSFNMVSESLFFFKENSYDV